MAKVFSMAALTYGGYIGWDKQDLDSIRGAEQGLFLVASKLLEVDEGAIGSRFEDEVGPVV